MHLHEARRLTLTTVVATALLGAAVVWGGHPAQPPAEAGWLGSGSAESVTDQAARVPAVPVDRARVRHNKGTPRLSQSAYTDLDIPAAALLAYHGAAEVMAEVDPACGLSWTLLGAIGRVESDHGRYAGAQLLADGTSTERIRGVALDGTGPVARIRDTDAGLLDGDPVWDRAVGPMQFLPSTWSVVGVDADGDGVRSPDDLQDAALAAAVLLCSAPGHLDTVEGRRTAVFRYNPSHSYVASVLALERAYSAGEFDVPGALTAPVGPMLALRPAPDTSSPPDGPERPGKPDGGNETAAADPTPDGHDPSPEPDPTDNGDMTTGGTPGPGTPGPTDPPDSPDPDPSDSPDPDPSDSPDSPDTEPPGTPGPSDPSSPPDPPESPEPDPVLLAGVLTACGPDLVQWCLDEVLLDVGDDVFLGGQAGADLDADGVVESRSAELTGLAGTEVTVLATPDTAPAFVLAINDLAYDGR